MPALSTDGQDNSQNGGGPAAASAPARPYWIGIGVMAIGAVWLYGASGLPQGARYAAVGPGLFVTISGAALLVLGAILILQIWRGESFEPQEAEDAQADAGMDRRAFFTALVAVAVPIATMKPLGMPFTATIAFMLVANAFGSRRWWLDLICGAVLAALAWFLFARLGLQLGGFFPPLGF
ncbi:MAG: putative rane protein [Devosia sp.]|uniref:tripartite tricarboxylate transporter TctB family protein n=1 Tax=Devosia sp. TaxID=1871048 RepID=UPI002611A879|nr:tripartite tricarboxylate transporter TctB family protein [Devosia sp.]MDB5536407.1 putative rane protein [Devosia sp.]MDB5588504.1 putative rane protein [Devosia sp.]